MTQTRRHISYELDGRMVVSLKTQKIRAQCMHSHVEYAFQWSITDFSALL